MTGLETEEYHPFPEVSVRPNMSLSQLCKKNIGKLIFAVDLYNI